MKQLTHSLIASLVLTSFTANADIDFSGYGSLVVGKTLAKDERFTADFFEVGQYQDSLTFKPESMLALQATSRLEDNLRLTLQVTGKGSDNFQTDFTWLYLTYQAKDDWTIMFGRRNIPMYYYSEFYDVGFAYPWMRPPSNLYWWQIVQFNGLHVSKDFLLGDYANNVTFFYGNEYTKDNKEMGFYAEQGFYGSDVIGVNEDWENIRGINWNISGEIFDIRLVYMEHDLNRDFALDTRDVRIGPRTSQTLWGIGGSIDLFPVTLLFEANSVKRHNDVEDTWPTFLVSVIYNYEEFQPFISYSKADQERISGDNFEQHYLLSYGLRYNFASSASLKLQYDSFNDEGAVEGGWNFHGDSDTISLGIDFVF